MEFFIEYGYIGLFIFSFLAATILPLSSEILLGVLLVKGFDPTMSVGVATIGNVSGSFTNYLIGAYGGNFVVKKVLKISEIEFDKAKLRFSKYGIFSLFFAWVPIIGDPLTAVAGVLKINIFIFFITVSIGKFFRYVILAYTIIGGEQL